MLQKLSKYSFKLSILILASSYALLFLISPDFSVDTYLYSDLKKISDPWEYLSLWFEGKIYDVQPVRDIFLWIDLKGSSIFGYSFKIFTNILYTFLLALGTYSLAGALKIDQKLTTLFVLSHPVIFHISGVDTSKKHILSAVFTLFYLNEYFRYEFRRPWKLFSFLILALLSHPINILACLVPLVDIQRKLSKKRYFFGLIVLLIGSIALLNWSYYKEIYPILAGTNKIITAPFSDRILGLGKYTYQILFPHDLFYFYFKGSLTNLIGVIFLPVFIGLGLKKLNIRQSFVFLTLFFGGFLVVNSSATQIFHQDVYNTLSIVAAAFILETLISNKNYIFPIVTVFLFINLKTVYLKQDFKTFTLEMVKSHPSCRNLYNATTYFLFKKNREKFLEFSEPTLKRKCTYFAKGDEIQNLKIRSYTIYLSDNISLNQKIDWFHNKSQITEIDQLALLTLYAKKQDQLNFQKELANFKLHFKRDVRAEFISSDLKKICHQNPKYCL